MKFFLIFVTLLFLFGCSKESTLVGFGGNAKLNIFVTHHTAPIDSGIIKIKFNSLEAPTDDVYSYTQNFKTDSSTKVQSIISGLKQGQYYLYVLGWDPSISSLVQGGIPFTVDVQTNYNITIPTTEKH
jgi:hypothetical protein